MEYFNYKGLVKISYELNGKRYEMAKYNAGTPNLFKAFAMMMAGVAQCIDYAPFYIIIKKDANYISRQVNATGRTYANIGNSESPNWVCNLTFSIPSDYLTSSTSSSDSLVLLDKTGSMELAILSGVDLQSFSQASGLNLIVQWQMSVTNSNS